MIRRWFSAEQVSIFVVLGLLSVIVGCTSDSDDQETDRSEAFEQEVRVPAGFPTEGVWPAGWEAIRRSIDSGDTSTLRLNLLAGIERFNSSPDQAPPLNAGSVVHCAITQDSAPVQCLSGVVISGIDATDLVSQTKQNQVELEVIWDDTELRFVVIDD